MAASLNADDLIRGEWYALEQAGNLLHDALFLFERKRYSSAVVLGVFCREELGRARIYNDLRRQILKAGPVAVKTVRGRCRNHLEKLRRGVTSTVFYWTSEQQTLSDAYFDSRHPRYREAQVMMDRLMKEILRRNPAETHERRMRGLYVEPAKDGSGWNRPRQFKRVEAHMVLEHVANDYETHVDRLRYSDMERRNVLEQWEDRPVLPEARWPQFPSSKRKVG